MLIAVTGITGYIGLHFAQNAIASGHEIIALSRRCPDFPVTTWIPYDLTSSNFPSLPADTKVIIHLATNTSSHFNSSSQNEIFAVKQLYKCAQNVGAKFIFVSSQTARQNAPTFYGRNKWQIENYVLSSGRLVQDEPRIHPK
jgi:nucleoside-diphosphate-sugar epimerase